MKEKDYKKLLDKQDAVIGLLSEISRWIKVTNFSNVKALLLDTLSSEKEKKAYRYSDGRSSREIARLVGVDFRTVASWWKIWINIGIAEPVRVPRGKRAKAIFSLEALNIKIPRAKSGEKEG